MSVILFLDFDGVLHPEDAGPDDLFCHVGLLDQALQDLPQVQIVVSSTWRELHPLNELRASLGPLAPRVIGQNPVRPYRVQLPERLWSFVREGECVAWLRENQHPATPWVALDDHAWRFSPHCRNLLLTDSRLGLTPADAERLKKMLREARP